MNVAVLGYGPAGLIAAKVLMDEGHGVDIIGTGGKSVIGGAQYLNENVLNEHQTEPEGYIDVIKVGERDRYAEKVYGRSDIDVSWDGYEGRQPAWALGPVYDRLWDYFEDRLIHDTLNGLSLAMLVDTERYDVIFSSIPAHALCEWHTHHSFRKANISLVPISPVKMGNVILYNGRREDAWYRTSNIFGQAWTEFGVLAPSVQEVDPGNAIPDQELPIQYGFKPLGTNCDCHPSVVRIGRFGTWDRKILLHNVPGQVRAALDARGERGVVSL